MSWLHQLRVSIPFYERHGRSIKYVVVMYLIQPNTHEQEEVQVRGSYQRKLYSYSDLRAFYNELTMVTTVGHAKSCRAHEDEECPLNHLHLFTKWFPFPGFNPLVHFSDSRLQKRRQRMDNFVSLLLTKVRHESRMSLQAYGLAKCQVVAKIAQFFALPPNLTRAVLPSLSLNGWRAYMAQQTDIPQTNEEAGGNITSTIQSLPRLKIISVPLINTDSVLEDLRYQLLSIHGQGISDLQEPGISDQTLWDIATYVAARLGNVQAVEVMLSRSHNINACIGDGITALSIAARMGHEDVVLYLLERGAEVNLANEAAITPLIAACRNGRTDVVRHLLEAGADIKLYSKRGTHPLHAAIVAQSYEIVEMLLLNGSEVNMKTRNGTTPIHFIARFGLEKICELLLQYPVDLEITTANESTALQIATKNNHYGVVHLLNDALANEASRESVTSIRLSSDYSKLRVSRSRSRSVSFKRRSSSSGSFIVPETPVAALS